MPNLEDQIPSTKQGLEDWIKLMNKHREVQQKSLSQIDRMLRVASERLEEINRGDKYGR